MPDDDIADKVVYAFRAFLSADQRHAIDLFQISVISIPKFHVSVSSYHKPFGNDIFSGLHIAQGKNFPFLVPVDYRSKGHAGRADADSMAS